MKSRLVIAIRTRTSREECLREAFSIGSFIHKVIVSDWPLSEKYVDLTSKGRNQVTTNSETRITRDQATENMCESYILCVPIR